MEKELKCSKCGETYPIIDDTPRFYKLTDRSTHNLLEIQKYRNQDSWTSWRKKNHKFLSSSLSSISESSILLDVGAGPSHFAKLLEPYIHYAVDFRPYPDIDFVTDITKPLPIASRFFDVILLSNVLEHISEPLSLLLEINRILKPSGRLIMITPFLIKIHQAPHDFLRYTEYMFQYLFQNSGFSEFSIEPIGNIVDIYGIVLRSMNKHLVSQEHLSKLKYHILRILRFLEGYSSRISLRIAGSDVINQKDFQGYPQGYGCIAIR